MKNENLTTSHSAKLSTCINIRLPLDLFQEIDERAAKLDITRSVYIRLILNKYLKENPNDKNLIA